MNPDLDITRLTDAAAVRRKRAGRLRDEAAREDALADDLLREAEAIRHQRVKGHWLQGVGCAEAASR